MDGAAGVDLASVVAADRAASVDLGPAVAADGAAGAEMKLEVVARLAKRCWVRTCTQRWMLFWPRCFPRWNFLPRMLHRLV